MIKGLRVDRALKIVWQAAPRWTLVSAILVVVQALIPLTTLFILKLIVDRLTNGAFAFDMEGEFAQLLILIGAAFAVGIVGSFCSAVLAHANTMQSHLVSDHMQYMVQKKSIAMDLAYYENHQFYDKLHRAQRETPSRPLRIIQALTQLARNCLMLLGSFGLLFVFHWGVVIAVFGAALPILFYRLKQAEAIYSLHREKTATERMCSYLNQILTTAENAKEVRVFNYGPLMVERFRNLRSKLRTALSQISAQGSRRQFITESTAALAGYGALAFIAHAALKESISLGELVMFFGAFQVAMTSLRPTLSSLAEVYEHNLFLSTLDEFLAVSRTVTEPDHPARMPRPWRSGLRIENMSFRYPDTDHLVLTEINMEIKPGETVALVGRNGSGKTTLTKLLCRLYDPTSGSISIDGIDVRRFKTEELRREIGVIYQDFGRYHLSARENIHLGRSDLIQDDPAIVRVAQWAGIHDALSHLPNGYETILSRTLADGEELSVGQWQKLALARALLRDSQLILLDEPTSALDPAAEFDFFEKFRSMIGDRSALIISHRFSTVRLADRIFVLDSGRLIEQGDHESLMTLDGLYAGLFRKQASYYQNSDSGGHCYF